MKLVVDTSVVVAGFRSPTGLSARTLLACRNGEHRMVVSAAMIFEYEAVLSRPEHLRAAGATSDDVGRFVDAICAFADWVRPTWLWRPQLRDPDDEMVLEAAVSGAADIVTFNVRDFLPAERFGVRILTPRQLWMEIGHGQDQ
jgi:putative PIN family toxin of toxin-antitoxin system